MFRSAPALALPWWPLLSLLRAMAGLRPVDVVAGLESQRRVWLCVLAESTGRIYWQNWGRKGF
jgi:hypothetical protein